MRPGLHYIVVNPLASFLFLIGVALVYGLTGTLNMADTHFGSGLLVWGGLATLALGAVGMLRSRQLGRVGGYSIIMSSGMVIAAAGLDHRALTAGALFYLASSTLGAAALFLLAELVERGRQAEVDPPVPDLGERLPAFEAVRTDVVNLDDQEVPLVGRAIPGSVAFGAFVSVPSGPSWGPTARPC